ncbi:hypothetical protein BHM03_00039316 [Ensete ventricosum]|nr:hypothetical protein BHM03_00039316 [Ensete ventricosum]
MTREKICQIYRLDRLAIKAETPTLHDELPTTGKGTHDHWGRESLTSFHVPQRAATEELKSFGERIKIPRLSVESGARGSRGVSAAARKENGNGVRPRETERSRPRRED